jgi:hypothetical protein
MQAVERRSSKSSTGRTTKQERLCNEQYCIEAVQSTGEEGQQASTSKQRRMDFQ